jgi:antitoxin VapB
MGLNIKNSETERLVQELAGLTGESLTAAVTEAVRQRIERIKHEKRPKGALAAELMRIGRECADALAKAPGKMMEIEDLYDSETGLPK